MSLLLVDKGTSGVRQLQWPGLDCIRLCPQTLAQRRAGIGGSDANVIFSGDGERIRKLWLEKRGEAEPANLSDHLPVMLGCWTEPFNRQWFERVTGQSVARVGEVVQCSRYRWRRCTLDGFIVATGAVWEAKHSNAFASSDQIIERYMPQLQHNMAVTRAERAFLSILFGNHKFEFVEVAGDWLYQIELLEAESAFWDCVVAGREPVPALIPAPPKPIGVREVCLEGNNVWAAAAADWLENREAAKVHANASKALKQMVERDVARTFGHGVEAKRSRSGAITIRELSK